MPGQAAGQHLNPQGALNDALAGGVRASPKPDGEREERLTLTEALKAAASGETIRRIGIDALWRDMRMENGELVYADCPSERVVITVESLERHYKVSRPKRSRVEEMIAEHWRGDTTSVTAMVERTIRSVCEYVRTGSVFDASIQKLAADIERHFLEPR